MKTDYYSRNYPRSYGGGKNIPNKTVKGYFKYKAGCRDFEPYQTSGFIINSSGNFKIGGRNAPSQTHVEFIESIKKQLKKERASIQTKLDGLKYYGKLMGYSYDFIQTSFSLLVHCPDNATIDNLNENVLKFILVQYLFRGADDCIGCKFKKDLKYKDSFKELVILGERETVDGIRYLEVLSGVSDPVNFMNPTTAYYIYFDGKYFRVYTPSFGNWVDTKRKVVFGYDAASDMAELKHQGVKIDEVNETPEDVLYKIKPDKYTVYSDGSYVIKNPEDNYYAPWLDVCRKEFEYRLMKSN